MCLCLTQSTSIGKLVNNSTIKLYGGSPRQLPPYLVSKLKVFHIDPHKLRLDLKLASFPGRDNVKNDISKSEKKKKK